MSPTLSSKIVFKTFLTRSIFNPNTKIIFKTMLSGECDLSSQRLLPECQYLELIQVPTDSLSQENFNPFCQRNSIEFLSTFCHRWQADTRFHVQIWLRKQLAFIPQAHLGPWQSLTTQADNEQGNETKHFLFEPTVWVAVMRQKNYCFYHFSIECGK